MKTFLHNLGDRKVMWNKPDVVPLNKGTEKPKEYKAHTSVTLTPECILELMNGAEQAGIHYNHLMVILLRYAATQDLSFLLKRTNPRIGNQERRKDYVQVNFYLSQRDYERNLDMKRFFKVNVSQILAYAISHFLDIIINKILREKEKNNDFSSNTSLNIYLTPLVTKVKRHGKTVYFVSKWRILLE